MHISYKCDMEWKDLDGGSNLRRHCQQCDTAVYNLSGMTRAQAQRVLKLHEGEKLCVHFVARNGRIVHDSNPLAQLDTQRRGAGKLLAAALLVQTAVMSVADEPYRFDPFSEVAKATRELVTQPIEQKFQDANDGVTTGMVTF